MDGPLGDLKKDIEVFELLKSKKGCAFKMDQNKMDLGMVTHKHFMVGCTFVLGESTQSQWQPHNTEKLISTINVHHIRFYRVT